MVVDVQIRRTGGGRFLASTSKPFLASAEGVTQDEAVSRLKGDIEEGLRNGTTTVHVMIGETLPTPVWPQDEFTAAWLEGIRLARRAADTRLDPWESDEQVSQ